MRLLEAPQAGKGWGDLMAGSELGVIAPVGRREAHIQNALRLTEQFMSGSVWLIRSIRLDAGFCVQFQPNWKLEGRVPGGQAFTALICIDAYFEGGFDYWSAVSNL